MKSYGFLTLFLLTLFLQNGFITSIETPLKREIIGDVYHEKRTSEPIGNEDRRKIIQKRENSLYLRHRKLVHPEQRNFESDHESKDRPMSDSPRAQSHFHDTQRKRSTQDVHKTFNFSNPGLINSQNNRPILAKFKRKSARKSPFFVRKSSDPKIRDLHKNRRKIIKRRRIKKPRKITLDQPQATKNTKPTNQPENLFDQILNEISTTARPTTEGNNSAGNITSFGRNSAKNNGTVTDLKTRASKPRRVAIRRTKLPQSRQNSVIKHSITSRQRKISSGRLNKIDITVPEPERDKKVNDYLDDYFEDIQELFDSKFSSGGNNLHVTPADTSNARSDSVLKTFGKQLSPGKLIPTPVKSINNKEAAVLKPPKNQPEKFIQVPVFQPRKNSLIDEIPTEFADVEHGPSPSIERKLTNRVKSPKISQSLPSNVNEYDYSYENYDEYDHDSYYYDEKTNILDNFKYGYKINAEESGNFQTRTEERNGKTVRGSYEVALPDGRIQIVTYIADGNGFRADVSYIDKDNHAEKSKIFSKFPAHLHSTKESAVRKPRKNNPSASHRLPVKKHSVARNSRTSKKVLPEFEDTKRISFSKSANRISKSGSTNSGKQFSRGSGRPTVGPNDSLGRSVSSRFTDKLFDHSSKVAPKLNTIKNTNMAKDFIWKKPHSKINHVSINREDFNRKEDEFNSLSKNYHFRTPPKPKPIPPPGHRQVAKIPPNPFQIKQSKNVHTPVHPNPQQIGNINNFSSREFHNHISTKEFAFPNELRPDLLNTQRKPEEFLGNHGFSHSNKNKFNSHQKKQHKSFNKYPIVARTTENVHESSNGLSQQRVSRLKNKNHLRSLSPSLIPPALTKDIYKNARITSFANFKQPSLNVEPPHSNVKVEAPRNGLKQTTRIDSFRQVSHHNDIFSRPPSTAPPSEVQNIPVIFQYTSQNGEVSPPLLYNPKVPVYVKSLGQTHSIPLLLPLLGNHVAVKRKRRKPENGGKLSESELFLNRPDIYPQPRRQL